MHIVYEENDAMSGISSNIPGKKGGGGNRQEEVEMGKYTRCAKC